MDKRLRGDWLRVMFADDGSVYAIEVCVSKETKDDFLSSLFKTPSNVVAFRVLASGASASLREWRGVLSQNTL